MANVTPQSILIGERAQQLDMLLHIQEFSSMVVLITGVAQMGKTALVQAARQQLSIHHQVIAFSATEVQSEESVVQMIAQQLGVLPSWSAIDQSLEKMKSQGETLNLLVDDAHLLPIECMTTLVQKCLRENGWHLVVAGDETIQDQLNQIQHNLQRSNLYHHIELNALSQNEAEELIAECYKQAGHESVPISLQKMAHLWQLSQGVPGKLLEFVNVEKQKQTAKAARFPFGHLVASLLIGSALLVSFLYQEESEVGEEDVIATLLKENSDYVESNVDNKAITVPINEAAKKADTAAISQSIQTAPTKGILITPSIAIDQITPQKTLDKEVAVTSVIEPTGVVDELSKKSEQQVPRSNKAISKSISKPKPIAISKAVVKNEVRHPLLGAAPESYALQLVGVRSESNARSVLQQFKSQLGSDKLSVYETKYKGQPWFVVVYGPMSSRKTASQQAGRIGKTLKSEPWVRPMAKIQEDIRKVAP